MRFFIEKENFMVCISVYENMEDLLNPPYTGVDFYFNNLSEAKDLLELCISQHKIILISKCIEGDK